MKGSFPFRGVVVDVQGTYHYEDFNTKIGAEAFVKGSFAKVIKNGWINGRKAR